MKKTLFIFLMATVLVRCAIQEKRPEQVLSHEPAQKHSNQVLNPASAQNAIETIFYPMQPGQPRLQLLNSITDSKETLSEFRDRTEYLLQIKRPYDIGAIKGKIYISDRSHKKIIVLNLENKEVNIIMADYESAGIWVSEDDYKYAADFKKNQIIVFDNNNQIARVYAYMNQFDKPVDVAVYKNKIYICDLNKHQIIVLDKYSGKTIQEIGDIGLDDGKFYKPTHVTVDTEGNLYVNDSFNFRIQKFDSNGKFLKKFGFPGDTLGGFARPKGLSLDREGHLYVVDAAFENVQIFDDKTTDLLLFFGGFGLIPGSMYLPDGIYIDYDNVEYFKEYADENFNLKYLVYVGNALGPIKLNVYGFGEWVGAPVTENE